MKEIGIGLLGFGTVGAGVVEGLQKNGDLIASRFGVRPVLRKIADIDLKTNRGVKVSRSLLTTDALAVIRDPSIQVIVELIGGTRIARTLSREALSLGKPVVTANKALLAEHGAELFKLARAHATNLWFEASVGGGIPIIRALREGLVANRIERVYGILNGTCNYILTRMEHEGLAFDDVLAQAQKAGYAEADPGLDIDGIDTAHKAVVLASLAYGQPIPMKAVHIEGIRGMAKADLDYALGLGYRLKLLAVIKNEGGGIEVRVHPTLVPLNHMLASVSGVFNAIFVEGDIVGQTLYYGRGAGRLPTASAVISDIADVSRELSLGGVNTVSPFGQALSRTRFRPRGEVETRYYLRVSLLDKPGVLGHLATILGQHHVSIASVLQKEVQANRHVPVVILTHRAQERHIDAALRKIDRLAAVRARTIKIRIEDLA